MKTALFVCVLALMAVEQFFGVEATHYLRPFGFLAIAVLIVMSIYTAVSGRKEAVLAEEELDLTPDGLDPLTGMDA